jgi:hypothetical protein
MISALTQVIARRLAFSMNMRFGLTNLSALIFFIGKIEEAIAGFKASLIVFEVTFLRESSPVT